MPSGTAARRYAQAVFDMADEQGTLDAWERDLGRLADALNDPTLATFFDSPQIPAGQKRDTARRLLGDQGQPLTLNLVGLLIERGRFALLPKLYTSFHDLLLARRGIVVGEVTTAVPLTAAEMETVRAHLRTITHGQDVEVRTKVDPSIIGGIVVRIGDQLLDGSVTNKLRRLRDQLASRR